MNKETIKFIVARVIENALEFKTTVNRSENPDFYDGRNLAYYETLDIIKNELIVNGQDLKEFGLDVNLEETFL